MQLAARAENGAGYSRTHFGDWRDANGDCQNTRAEVLIAESKVAVTYASSSHCSVKAGRWYSRYDVADFRLVRQAFASKARRAG